MMTEKLTTIARPYALAAFESALAKSDIANWAALLQAAAEIMSNKSVSQLLNNPKVTQAAVVEMVCDILQPLLDTEKKNFICLLAEYDRLFTLPEISRLFADYQADYEKTIKVQVTSATLLDVAYQQKFTQALTQRLQRKVELECAVDESLIGGAILRAGDQVIDGSIRGKLNRLLESL